jgi:hypothetical protein
MSASAQQLSRRELVGWAGGFRVEPKLHPDDAHQLLHRIGALA